MNTILQASLPSIIIRSGRGYFNDFLLDIRATIFENLKKDESNCQTVWDSWFPQDSRRTWHRNFVLSIQNTMLRPIRSSCETGSCSWKKVCTLWWKNIVLLHGLGHDSLHKDEATKIGVFKEFSIFNIHIRDSRMKCEANIFATQIALPNDDFLAKWKLSRIFSPKLTNLHAPCYWSTTKWAGIWILIEYKQKNHCQQIVLCKSVEDSIHKVLSS